MKTFTQTRRGYDPAEVDAYIRELETALALKNTELEIFKQKETAITKSVIDAQLLADNIKAQALEEVAGLRSDALQQMEDIRAQVNALHTKLSAFQNEYAQILQRYLISLRCDDLQSLFNNLEKFMSDLGMDTAFAEETPVELTDLYVGE